MSSLEVFKIAKGSYSNSDISFLKKQVREMTEYRGLKGISILHTIPLSLETIIKLEPIIASGANITVCPTRFLKPSTQPIAERLLERLGVRYL